MTLLSKNLPPLAERIRPNAISEISGQTELIHKNSLLSKAISAKQLFSIILWGPPGTGKTTLARILSREFESKYFELSAISSGVKEIRKIINEGSKLFEIGRRTILFIDEIHRFSKSQQDSLLNAIENGTIILIGATTENPSYQIIPPLLSRCQILRLYSLTYSDLNKVLNRAIKTDIILSQKKISINNDVKSLLIESSGGDARKMINTLELAISTHNKKNPTLTLKNINEALQQKHIIYDKTGAYHYDVISAYIKSIRGSDPDAAIYWLAVMLESGEKPEFIARRLIILASEDIGNAEPYALQLATSAFDAVNKIGMPESRIILAQITTYLAAVPKSNASYIAIDSALKIIRENGTDSVPIHLRNANTNLMKSEGNGKKYKYTYSFDNNFINENYFPDSFPNPPQFYNPQNEGREKFLKERLNKLWKDRYK